MAHRLAYPPKIGAPSSAGKENPRTRPTARLLAGPGTSLLLDRAFVQWHAMAPARYRTRVMRAGFPAPRRTNMSRPGVAALLSFIIPGVGQIYNGDILRGLFWLIITPGLWVGSGGLLGWVCHIFAAATAYTRGEKKEQQRLGWPVRS
jgi:hypothetical protein